MDNNQNKEFKEKLDEIIRKNKERSKTLKRILDELNKKSKSE